MAHLVQTMAYVGATPWHGLGNQLTNNQPLQVWAKQAGIGLTLVSDFNRVALKAFKVKDTRVIPEKTGLLNVAKRSVFVADKAGNVIHSEVKRDPSSMPNFAKIKKAVEA